MDIVIFIAGGILTGWVAATAWQAEAATHLEIMHRDTVEQFPLAGPRTITVRGPLGETRIEIHDGRARIAHSPCTRKICVRSGWLEHAGEATACVPNRVSLALLGNEPRFDAMSF